VLYKPAVLSPLMPLFEYTWLAREYRSLRVRIRPDEVLARWSRTSSVPRYARSEEYRAARELLFGVLPSRRYEVARRVRRIYLPHGSFRTDERQRWSSRTQTSSNGRCGSSATQMA